MPLSYLLAAMQVKTTMNSPLIPNVLLLKLWFSACGSWTSEASLSILMKYLQSN